MRREVPFLLQLEAEVVGVRADREGVAEGDQAVLVEVEQALVEGLHAVVLALGDHLFDRVRLLGVDDAVEDAAGHHQHLGRRDAAGAVGPLEEPLAHDAPERRRQRQADLLLLERREEVDDPVHRLGGVGGVQRRDHEVAGLGRRQRRPHRLGVAHLADEDHVGVLAQHPAHGRGVVDGVGADLPLVDDRLLVGVQHLDRVLDRHDVDGLGLVDVVDHGGDRRGLARAGRTGDQHHAAVLLGQPAHHRGQAERLERRGARQHPPEDEADRAALAEHVHPEAAQAGDAVGEVGLAAVHELVGPVLRHDREGHALGVGGRHERERRRRQVPVDAHERGRAHLDVEVGAPLLDRVPKQLVEIQHVLLIGTLRPRLSRRDETDETSRRRPGAGRRPR